MTNVTVITVPEFTLVTLASPQTASLGVFLLTSSVAMGCGWPHRGSRTWPCCLGCDRPFGVPDPADGIWPSGQAVLLAFRP